MMFRKRLGICLLAALLAVASTWCVAGGSDFVVIVNKANRSSLDKATVAKIYSGDLVAWPDGTRVAAVDLPENDPTRVNFSRDVLGKTVSSVKALWAQLVFSGRALPPKQAATDEDVKKFVISNRGGIGYIRPSSVDDTVRAEN
jgi:ABC-type phosphate transport system substrate-binding protein